MAAPMNEDDLVSGASSDITSKHEFLYKVLVVGEFGVGKTSIIKRYTEGFFSPNYKLTIGVDFALKTLQWDEHTKVNLQLWDIAGHERFGHMTRVYYKYAIGAIIVFDLSRPATFDSVIKWLNDVNSKVMLANGDPVPIILLANKCDLDDCEIDEKSIAAFVQQNNLLGWFATSAKLDHNIDECMRFIVQRIIELPSEGVKPVEHIKLMDSTEYLNCDLNDEEPPVTKRKHVCCDL
ncbi:ras-related protein Rab-32-like [Tubulanus polymorphus]|uniref:ras-related protein Rab-32-like n=1 Tax=Tubulanus polymorphus TaxID=672921 RepID=UPI003DA551A4